MKITIIDDKGNKIDLDIKDSDVKDYIHDNWDDAEEKVGIALKIGVMTLKNASTSIDTNYVDKEFQKLQIQFNERFRTFQDEWEKNLNSVFGEDFVKMKDCMDPDRPETPMNRTVEYLDNRIKQMIQDMDPNEESTPIGKFKKDMISRMNEIKTLFETKKATDAVKEKGTAKGVEYEDEVYQVILEMGTPAGDTVIPTGSEPGVGGNKKGDVVVEISDKPDLKFVIEAKKKTIALNQKFYDDEIKGAMDNRGASMAILVVHPNYNPGDLPFYYFKDAIVSEYDPEVDDRTAISVAYQLARKISIETSTKISEGIDLNRFKDKLETIMAHVDHISKIEGALTNSINNLDKIKSDVQSTKEKLKDSLNDLIKDIELEKAEAK